MAVCVHKPFGNEYTTDMITVTVVVSPLLALMNNQVAALRNAEINVGSINSNTPYMERKRIMDDLQCGHPRTKLLYVTPEFCAMDHFRKILRVINEHCELARIAIDEAHCISEWGHDFRPAFQQLSFFKREFPGVPVICCTATATSRVRHDIISTLGLDPMRLKVFTMTTSRPNLHYEVRFRSDDLDHYDDFLKWIRATHARRAARSGQLAAAQERATNVSGIIYTLFRKDCEALAARLCQDGIGAKPYHAGLSINDRDDHLKGWVDNREGYDVIVATTAFGMGIDKENVRFVVHWQIPKSFEGFYQEAGRAGRDGKASICILYYGREDRDRASTMLQLDQQRKNSHRNNGAAAMDNMMSRAKSLQSLVSYCENTGKCRHRLICDYFGEQVTPACDYACDWHKDAAKLARAKDDGLASEEWCSTQREAGAYAVDDYD
jgi:RecQ family ATP-dependent DNA helicase